LYWLLNVTENVEGHTLPPPIASGPVVMLEPPSNEVRSMMVPSKSPVPIVPRSGYMEKGAVIASTLALIAFPSDVNYPT
jgi:hypothetical protein